MQTNKDVQRSPSTSPSAPSSIGSTTSYLGPGLQIKGEITGSEDLKLGSKVEGLVSIGGGGSQWSQVLTWSETSLPVKQ
jgi:hypothetical protein